MKKTIVIVLVALAALVLEAGLTAALSASSTTAGTTSTVSGSRQLKDQRYAQIINQRYMPAPLTNDVLIRAGHEICIRDNRGGALYWMTQNLPSGFSRLSMEAFTRGYYVDDGCSGNDVT